MSSAARASVSLPSSVRITALSVSELARSDFSNFWDETLMFHSQGEALDHNHQVET